MSNLGNDIAQQDALSNAFLAIFGILLLLLVQVGLENAKQRIEQQIYGKVPDFNPAWTGGPGKVAVWPRGDVLTVLASDSPDLQVQLISSGAQMPPPETGTWSNGTSARLYLFDRATAPAQQSLVTIAHIGVPGASAIDLDIGLDAAAVGAGSSFNSLAPGEALYIHLCKGGAAYASTVQAGSCP